MGTRVADRGHPPFPSSGVAVSLPADPPRRAPRVDKRAERWKHLLRRPPEPRLVSAEDYVAELNRRLEADRSYRPGTRFVVASPGVDAQRAGPTWEGPDAMKPVVQRIVQSMVGEYLVEPPFFSDR